MKTFHALLLFFLPCPLLAFTHPQAISILQEYEVSFNCAKASCFAEIAACTQKEIGQLDGLLMDTYKNRLYSPNFGLNINKMKKEQKKWIAKKNQCKETTCVINSYKQRIQELCNIVVVTGVHWTADCDRVIDEEIE